MTARQSGAARIFLYNWPKFALTWGGAVVVVAAVAAFGAARIGPVAWLAAAGALFGALWAALSLVVSHYVYDRSKLAGGSWVPALLPPSQSPLAWAAIDAGLDAEVALDDVLPSACRARIDIYDGVVVRAPSVQRARALTPRAHAAQRANAASLPLADAGFDFIAVVFSAHEIRDTAVREKFFHEVKRALRVGGRMLVVEHLRDLPNFIAFGPGFFHFQPRAEWLRLAREADLHVVSEERVTPWVMALSLEKLGGAA